MFVRDRFRYKEVVKMIDYYRNNMKEIVKCAKENEYDAMRAIKHYSTLQEIYSKRYFSVDAADRAKQRTLYIITGLENKLFEK